MHHVRKTLIQMKNLILKPGGAGWTLTEDARCAAFSTFVEREQAIETATAILRGVKGSLKIYGQDGALELKQFFSAEEDSLRLARHQSSLTAGQQEAGPSNPL